MKSKTNPLFSIQVHLCRMAALALTLSAISLTGCSDSPHDRVEAPAPATMTTLPTPAKTTADKLTPKPDPAPPTEAEMGMPIYPNAKLYVGLTGDMVKPDIDAEGATAVLETPDTLDKVLDYYKEHMKETDARGSAVPATPREGKTDNNQRKIVLLGNDAQQNIQMAQLREENGKTVIQLMRSRAKIAPPSVSGGK